MYRVRASLSFTKLLLLNKNEVTRFGSQKIKGQGRSVTEYSKNAIFGDYFHDIFGMHW